MAKHEFAERAGLKLINPRTTLHVVGVDTSGRTYFGRIVFNCPSKHQPAVIHTFAVDVEIRVGNPDLIDGPIGGTVFLATF